MYVAKLVVDQAGLFPKVCSGDANNIYLQFCLCPLQKVLRSSHADYPADICQLSHHCQTKAGLRCGSVYFAFDLIQGVSKKGLIFCCLIFRQQCIGFLDCFFPLRTEIHTQILNAKPILCQNIYKTKCGSETYQFILILSHSCLKTAKFAPRLALIAPNLLLVGLVTQTD